MITRSKFLRMVQGKTQDDLAAATRINRVVIANIENGRVVPSTYERAAIAGVLGCLPDRLLDQLDESSLKEQETVRA